MLELVTVIDRAWPIHGLRCVPIVGLPLFQLFFIKSQTRMSREQLAHFKLRQLGELSCQHRGIVLLHFSQERVQIFFQPTLADVMNKYLAGLMLLSLQVILARLVGFVSAFLCIPRFDSFFRRPADWRFLGRLVESSLVSSNMHHGVGIKVIIAWLWVLVEGISAQI